jgi:hypothetical protein
MHREPLIRPLAACPNCGGEWLDARYDYDAAKSRFTDLGAASRPHLSRTCPEGRCPRERTVSEGKRVDQTRRR